MNNVANAPSRDMKKDMEIAIKVLNVDISTYVESKKPTLGVLKNSFAFLCELYSLILEGYLPYETMEDLRFDLEREILLCDTDELKQSKEVILDVFDILSSDEYIHLLLAYEILLAYTDAIYLKIAEKSDSSLK